MSARDRSPSRKSSRPRSKEGSFRLPEISIEYEFGDAGSSWRMMKLKRTLEAVQEGGHKSKSDIILERYGSEIEFNVAEQEREELDSRRSKPKGEWVYKPVARVDLMMKAGSMDRVDVGSDTLSLKQLVDQERNAEANFDKESAMAILKDSAYANDNDYQEENAKKLANYVQDGRIKLQSSGSSRDPQVLKRIMKNLDRCELCNKTEVKPISMGQHTYITLLPSNSYNRLFPSNTTVIALNGHYNNTLYCDDEEWDEIENFMKSLAKFYYKEYKKGVVFIENATLPIKYQKNHAHILAVPVSMTVYGQAEGYFKEGILSSSNELDGVHKAIVDTKRKSEEIAASGVSTRRQAGLKRLIAKEAAYYHVWLTLDGGLGHIVDDLDNWPKYDLFTRQVVGEGLLKCEDPMLVNSTKDYKKWLSSLHAGEEGERVERFRKKWKMYDWTAPEDPKV